MATAFDAKVWVPEAPASGIRLASDTIFYGVLDTGAIWIKRPLKKKIPSNLVAMGCHRGTEVEAVFLAQELQTEVVQSKRAAKARPKPLAGSLVLHEDLYGHHHAFCLDYVDGWCLLLFMTSKPDWNSSARKITAQEHAASGFRKGADVTFLAPVVRPASEVSLVASNILTEARVKQLRAEFFSDLGSVWMM